MLTFAEDTLQYIMRLDQMPLRANNIPTMFEGLARFEFKYHLPPDQSIFARDYIAQFLDRDPEAGQAGSYTVTSLYFDTPHLSDYYEKGGGFLVRKKLRARIYGSELTAETPNIFLEVKKKYDMAFLKHRVRLSREEWDEFLSGKYSSLLARPRKSHAQKDLEAFLFLLLSEGRTPQYFIRYIREPFISTIGDPIRVTFDSAIECASHDSLSSPAHTYPTASELTVLEVKFTESLPYWFTRLERDLNLARDTYSKYANGVDATSRFNPLPR